MGTEGQHCYQEPRGVKNRGTMWPVLFASLLAFVPSHLSSFYILCSVTMSFTRTDPEASEWEGTLGIILFIPLVFQREMKPREAEWLPQNQPACWRQAGPEHRAVSPCRDTHLWGHSPLRLSRGSGLAVWALSNSLHLSESQFPYLWNEANKLGRVTSWSHNIKTNTKESRTNES